VQELVLLETLKALLNAAMGALSRGEPDVLAEVSRQVNLTAEDVIAASRTLGCVALNHEAQGQRQKLLAQIRRQRSFCLAMLRRWRRSILLRQQLLDLATTAATYPEPITSPLVMA
jgi:hypothetical protein